MTSRESDGLPDLTSDNGRELYFTVPPGVASEIYLRVEPGAVCGVSSAENDDEPLKVIADPEGVVRFHVDPSAPSTDIASLEFEADAGGRVAVHRIDLRLEHEPTSEMPPPPVPGPDSWPRGGHARSPLSDDEMMMLSDEELLDRRYPVRPNRDEAPRAFDAWRRAVAAPAAEVESVLVPRPGVTHGLAQAGPATSFNWSGFELRDDPRFRPRQVARSGRTIG